MAKTDYRHQARSLALQALYELDCTDHPIQDVLSERISPEVWRPETRQLAEKLVRGVRENQRRLDDAIRQHAPEWPLEQLATIDRNILRIAVYELAENSVPLKVAINEAIELAKAFGTESTPRFINGVLGSLVAQPEALHNALQPTEAATNED